MKFRVLKDQDVTPLEETVMLNGQLQVVPADVYKQFTQELISLFCVKHAFYCLPTVELVNWVSERIKGFKTIEIGSGNGVLGRALGIHMTDSFMQNWPEVAAHYRMVKQPTVKYGQDVKCYDAKKAIKKYTPHTIVAAWVTQIYKEDDGPEQNSSMYGINENWLIGRVKQYIHIGHEASHTKRILKYKHTAYKFPWLISRSIDADGCVIYVWENGKQIG